MRPMMSRPVVLVLLLLFLVVTSYFEWKEHLVTEAEATPLVSRRKQFILDKEEVVKEKIILSQEKNIQQLNELVQSLQRQLTHCRGMNNTINSNVDSLTEHVNDEEREQILEK